jgi:hypothetical protein
VLHSDSAAAESAELNTAQVRVHMPAGAAG